jgi:hypothetical protein
MSKKDKKLYVGIKTNGDKWTTRLLIILRIIIASGILIEIIKRSI